MMKYRNTVSAVLLFLSLTLSPAFSADGMRDIPDTGEGLRSLNIPAAAFSSAGLHDDDVYFFSFSDGKIEGTGTFDGCIMAPALLPAGTILFQFEASLYDTDPLDYVWVDFYRIENYTGVVEKMGRARTYADSATPQQKVDSDIPYEYRVVETLQYSYYVTTCLNEPTQGVYSARFYYQDTGIFSDDFENGDLLGWSSVSR